MAGRLEEGSRDAKAAGTEQPLMAPEMACDEAVNAGFISYLISATLHGRGSLAFWGSGLPSEAVGTYRLLTRAIAVVDLFWHVALWLIVAIFEIWSYGNFQSYEQHRGTVEQRMADNTSPDAGDHSRVLLDELFVGQFTGFMIALVGLVISFVFGLLGQPSGKAWPSTICFLFGGLKASLLFTLLIIVVASDKWYKFNSVTEVGEDANQTTVTMRQMLLWLVGLKCLLLQQLSANEKFWGSASDDDAYANLCSLLSSVKSDKRETVHSGYKNNFLSVGGGHQEWRN
jgi:hypothetical protein